MVQSERKSLIFHVYYCPTTIKLLFILAHQEKTSGIDVTCEKINLDELIAVTDILKAHNRNTNIGYTVTKICSEATLKVLE